jgi:hypothetical protein
MQEVVNALGTAAATGDLEFDGADLVKANRRSDNHPAELILFSETIPTWFLAQASAAAIDWTFLGSSTRRTKDVERQLIAELADRSLHTVVDVFDAVDNPGRVLRLGLDEEWSDFLVSLTLPEITGDPELSTQAAVWIVDTVGRPDVRPWPRDAQLAEKVLFNRPTMLVQGPGAADHLRDAGLGVNDAYLSLGDDTTERALRRIFEAGQGDYLRMLEEYMVPILVSNALAEGVYPPSSTAAYGMIEGSITAAQMAVGIEDARSVDARNAVYRSLLDTTIGAGLSAGSAGVELAPVFVEAFVVDQAVGQGMDLLPMLSTDTELDFYRDLYQAELDHNQVANIRLVTTLADAGVLRTGPGDPGDEPAVVARSELGTYVDPRFGSPSWDKLFVAGPDGAPLPKYAADGARDGYLTVEDWIDALKGYDDGRTSELAAAHREVME